MRTRYDHLSLIAGLIFLASLLVPIAISEAAPDNLEFPAELFEGDVLNPVAFEDPVPFIERIQIRGELSDDELMLFLTLLQQIVQSGKANVRTSPHHERATWSSFSRRSSPAPFRKRRR